MEKHMTLEQVRDTLRAAQIDWTFNHGDGRTSSFRQLADAIDAHLRERETAKAGVTDEMVEYASRIYSDSSPFALQAMRSALEAVAPMLASARVPEGFDERKPKVPGYYLVRRFCLDDGEENRAACVEVRLYDDGTGEHLIVNLHEINTEDEPHGWYRVEDLWGEFQWLKLAAAPKPETEE